MSTVSVVIPAFNRANLIGATLRSILAQSHKASEIIVVDDGSTDETSSVVRSHGEGVHYIRTDNLGVQNARNVGAANATGEWIALCDSDDLWRADYLEKQLAFLGRNPGVDFLFSNFVLVVDDVWKDQDKFGMAPDGYWEKAADKAVPGGLLLGRKALESSFRFQPIFPSCVLLTKDLYERLGGYNTALRGVKAEDWEFALRCLAAGSVAGTTDPLVGIRKHDSNDSGDQMALTLGEIQIMEYMLREQGSVVEGCEDVIRNEIATRRGGALGGAFVAKNYKLVCELYRDLPRRSRSMKTRIKYGIARLRCLF